MQGQVRRGEVEEGRGGGGERWRRGEVGGGERWEEGRVWQERRERVGRGCRIFGGGIIFLHPRTLMYTSFQFSVTLTRAYVH